MKLAVKLSLSVALSACGAVVLALLSYLGADAIRQSVADVSRTVMPTAAASGHLAAMLGDLRTVELQIAFAPTEAARQEATRQGSELLDGLRKAISAFPVQAGAAKAAGGTAIVQQAGELSKELRRKGPVDATAEESAYPRYWGVCKATLEHYMDGYAQLASLLERQQQLTPEELQQTVFNQNGGAYRAARDLLVELFAHSSRIAEERAQASLHRTQATQRYILLTLGITVLVTVIFTAWIIRDTLRKLGKDPDELMAVTDLIAQGRLDIADDGESYGVFANIIKMSINLFEHMRKAQDEAYKAWEESALAQEAMQKAEAAQAYAERARKEGMLNAATQISTIVQTLTAAIEASFAKKTARDPERHRSNPKLR